MPIGEKLLIFASEFRFFKIQHRGWCKNPSTICKSVGETYNLGRFGKFFVYSRFWLGFGSILNLQSDSAKKEDIHNHEFVKIQSLEKFSY